MPEPDLVELGESDLPELAALCARTLPYDDCSPDLLRYTLVQGTAAEPQRALGLRIGGELAAVAVGARNPTPAGAPLGQVKMVATAPERRRRGFARRLLGELEGWMAAAGATAVRVQAARRYFVPGVDLRHSKALCLFDRLGYQRRGMTYNLCVDLARRSFDPAPLVAALAGQGITVRRLAAEDAPAFDHYLTTRWSPGWRYEGMQALALGQQPVPGHLALQDGEIVGFSVYDVTRPGWFGPIGTNQELRGREVGSALLHACLFDWQRQGRRQGEIAAIGPLYFYVTACDAAICRAFATYDKPLGAAAGPA